MDEEECLENEESPELIADYDKGGDPVNLNHLNADEGQRGTTGPGLMTVNLVRFNYHLVLIDLQIIVQLP